MLSRLHHRSQYHHLSFLITLIITWIRHTDASYIFDMESGESTCFRLRLPKVPTIVSGNYDILQDSFKGKFLSVWLQNLSAKAASSEEEKNKADTADNKDKEKKDDAKDKTRTKLWESTAEAREGTFSVTVSEPSQRIALCFEADWQSDEKSEEEYAEDIVPIGFNIRVHPIPRSLPDEEMGPDLERALRITEVAVSIETDWSNLMDHFEFLRSREVIHERLTNEILDRLMGWTILEAVVVILMSVGQVLYWRKFFEQRRYL